MVQYIKLIQPRLNHLFFFIRTAGPKRRIKLIHDVALIYITFHVVSYILLPIFVQYTSLAPTEFNKFWHYPNDKIGIYTCQKNQAKNIKNCFCLMKNCQNWSYAMQQQFSMYLLYVMWHKPRRPAGGTLRTYDK